MTGKPDWQEVPRGFNARELENTSTNINANTTITRTYTPDDTDDTCAILVQQNNVFIWIRVEVLGPLGDVIHQVTTANHANRPVWIPVQSAGGDIVLTIRNPNAGAANGTVIRAWSYIGLNAEELRPTTDIRSFYSTTFLAGATTELIPQNSHWFPTFTVAVNSDQTFRVDQMYTVVDATPPATFNDTAAVVVNGAALSSHNLTVPNAGLRAWFRFTNTSGAGATVRFTVTGRRR